MVRDLNINKKDALMQELKMEFPNLSDNDLDAIHKSFDELIESISAKSHIDRNKVEQIVEDKLEIINSKDLI